MHLEWILGMLLVLQAVQPDDVVEPAPPTGTVLQDAPGL